jgi:Tfp pilus assembly protein PilN
LNSRIYWSEFWKKLNEATPTTVYYSSLSLGENGVVSMSGAADNLTSIAKMMMSLEDSPVFSGVKLGNTSVKNLSGKEKTAFSVTVNVNSSELLKKPSK